MQIEDFFLCLGNLVGSFLGAEDYGKNYLGIIKKKTNNPGYSFHIKQYF